jgi:hypothetical protein
VADDEVEAAADGNENGGDKRGANTEYTCSSVNDSSTVTATKRSLTPTASRLSGGISMSSFLARNK